MADKIKELNNFSKEIDAIRYKSVKKIIKAEEEIERLLN